MPLEAVLRSRGVGAAIGNRGNMDEAQAEAARRRRRKSSARKKAATWPEYWRGPYFGRHLFIAMSLLAAAYAGLTLWETRLATFLYNGLWLGASESEVRYMLGPPDAVEAGGRVFRYSERGREIAVRISPAGRTTSISCAPAAQGPSTCPAIRGIGIGTTEDQVLLRFGAPSRVAFRGDAKTIYYDGLGLTLHLSLFKVRELEVREGGSFTGYFPHALWALVP